ncbi:MAG TPA: hypothetical protein VF719_09590 [Abditibacteriaceae bacterium]|jgi:hypothetical protein
MSYHILDKADGTTAITLKNEPVYCHTLHQDVEKLEDELKRGLWLVLLFVPWSATDIGAIGNTLKLVKSYEGKIQLGIRPLRSHDDVRLWCKNFSIESSTPVWIIFKDGVFVEEHLNTKLEEIRRLVERHLNT